MNINYRILKIDNEAHSVVVRYFTDVVSENDLSSMKNPDGSPVLGEDGYPIQCMTDTSLTLYDVQNPTEADVDVLVKRAVPSDWLKLREDIKLGTVASDLSGLSGINKSGSFVFVASDPLQENQVAISSNVDPNIIVTSQRSTGYVNGTPTVNSYQLQTLLSYLNLNSNDKVYDLATGSGRIAIQAAKRGAGSVVGIDIDPEAVTRASLLAADENVNVAFVNDDIFNVSYSDATVLLINLPHGLLHRFALEVFPTLPAGVRVVSFANAFQWVKPDAILCEVDKDVASYIWITK